MTATPDSGSGWFGRPATWKAVLFVVAYLVFYLLVGRVTGRLFADRIDDDNIVASASSIVFGIALPIAIGGAALLALVARLGWLRDIFGRQPVRGRGWMWIGPLLVIGAIVAHVTGTDFGEWTGSELAALAVFGVCVGFTEELATRGVAVKIIRDAGHTERYVAVVSSLLFALMHTANLFTGMALATVAVTVVYTFAFGMCMYLAMRVTGSIWTAIVLHGLTDPTTILATGGLDEAVANQNSGASAAASAITTVLILFGFAAAFFVRGKHDVSTAPSTTHGAVA